MKDLLFLIERLHCPIKTCFPVGGAATPVASATLAAASLHCMLCVPGGRLAQASEDIIHCEARSNANSNLRQYTRNVYIVDSVCTNDI